MFRGITVLCKLILIIGLVLPQMGWAQDAPATDAPAAASTADSEPEGAGGPRKQLATIVFAGLGGAILGLSTLSFYGRPQDKLSNIAIGFALGVIIGTSMVTFRAATNPDQFYNGQIEQKPLPEALTPVASLAWSFDF